MTTALLILALGAALVFVGLPFFQSAPTDETAERDSLSPIERQKRDAIAAIKEAEFDLRMDKLSDADFQLLEQRYRQQALAAIAAQEKVRTREERGRAPARGKSRFAFCPDCGQKLLPATNFCGHCGRSLRDAVA
jgi:zinc-ribbon domain